MDFEGLAASIPLQQIPAVLERLSDNEHDQNLRAELLRLWASLNPAEAAQWAATVAQGDLRLNALTTVAAQWANKDIQAAHQWAQSLAAAERDTVTVTLVTQAASQSALKALELALQIGEPAARASAAAFAAAQWAAEDPQAALNWTMQVTDRQLREQLDRRVVSVVAETAPLVAIDYLLDHNAQMTGYSQAQIAVAIAQRWAQQAPEAAAGWVESFADPAVRGSAINAVIRIWSQSDPAETRQWLSRQSDSAFRDEATSACVSVIAPENRALASELAETIQDLFRRRQVLAEIASLVTQPHSE